MTGCASVNMATKEESAKAKEFKQPSPGNAGVYVYRNSFVGKALKKDIWIDGKCVGESAPDVFFYTEVQGGKTYKIDTESEFSPNTLELMLAAGKNYFIRQYIKMGVFVGGAGLEPIPEEQGKKDVAQLEMAKPGKCSGQATPTVSPPPTKPLTPASRQPDKQIAASGLASKPAGAVHLDLDMVLNRTWIYPHPNNEARYGNVELSFAATGLTMSNKRGSANGTYEVRNDQLCIFLESSGTTCYFLLEEAGERVLFFPKSGIRSKLSIR